MKIVLGSSSKWRKRELEKMTGLSEIKCISPDIDEKGKILYYYHHLCSLLFTLFKQ